jgi:nucleoside-diphosphate-sugar epimerase
VGSLVSSPAERSAIVAGATSLVGRPLVPLLLERGLRVQAISRRPPAGGSWAGPAPSWVALDLGATPWSDALEPATILVHMAPLWLLPDWLPRFEALGVRRLVAFGSTSRYTKAASPSAAERETARRLAQSEEATAT